MKKTKRPRYAATPATFITRHLQCCVTETPSSLHAVRTPYIFCTLLYMQAKNKAESRRKHVARSRVGRKNEGFLLHAPTELLQLAYGQMSIS